MKRISKSLRGISPFSRRQNGNSSESNDHHAGAKMNTDELQSPSDDENTSLTNNSLDNTYSLNGVSFKDFLLYFYSKFNPDKISMIDYIAQEYAGDELIMISNMADKYQLSSSEMQRLIDVSKRTRGNNGNNGNRINNKTPQSKFQAPPSETDSEPESEPNSEPVSELSYSSSLRNTSSALYAQQRGAGRKGVSFSEANSVRTFDRHASPSRNDLGSRIAAPSSPSSTPASLQDIINRNKQQHDPAVTKSNLAHRSLLGNSLLSPSQQPGSRKPSPSLRSPSPTIGKGNGPKAQLQPHPAPIRSSSPLQSLVRNQVSEESVDPAAQQRMLNQKNLRDKMLQNQQQEALHQQRQNMLMHQQQEREQQQQQQLLGQEEQRLLRQQEEEEKQRQLQQVVLDDQQYLAQQVRTHNTDNQGTHSLQQQQQMGDGGNSAGHGGGDGDGDGGAQGTGRTQTVHIEEIQQELARTREALTAADQEREEVLRLLEDMAAAPHSLRMQNVVEEYLAGNRTRSNSLQTQDLLEHDKHSQQENAPHQSHYQLQLQHAQEQRNHKKSASGGDSVASSTSNSLRGLRDLEGGQEHRPRTIMSPHVVRGSEGAAAKSNKSYMLGTASSSKRETNTAMQGGKTGAFNIHASGNGRHPSPMFERPSSAASSSASSRGRASSTGGQQFGKRFIRPSGSSSPSSRGSRTSRGRSASPAGSEYSSRRGGGVGMRSSSPSSSITSADVERQYVNTKQRINHSTQQAQGNQQMGQRRIEQVSKDATLERQKAILKKPITDSPSRQRNVNSELVTDWVVCVDPKTQKKYYYSRSLSKSTWTAPPHLAAAAATAAPTAITTNSGPSSRAGSITSKTRGTGAARGRDSSSSSSSRGRERERDSSSPAGSIAGSSRHTVRSSSPAGSTASSRGGGGGSAIWKSVKDPKSGRTYWFNRKTRESTWKNPFEVA